MSKVLERILPFVVLTLLSSGALAHDGQNASKQFREIIEPAVCSIEDNGQDYKLLQMENAKLNRNTLRDSLVIRANTLRQSVHSDGEDAVAGRYYIPVVFHVYGAKFNCDDANDWCLTDEKIADALRRTNDDFLGLNNLDGPIDPIFQAIRQNLSIEFVLAKRDPHGNPSTGIVRYNREQKGYANHEGYNEQIAAEAWDNYRYMNIYIMEDLYADNKLNSSGVAWYPQQSMSDQGLARVVYNGRYLGDNSNENFRSVLTHEFGHWLNLPHVFQGNACSLQAETFCSLSGDRVCDTPQMNSSSLKNNAQNCLGQKTNTENFMHYTDNYAMFTVQQVQRMMAALHGAVRYPLWQNENLIAAGLETYVSNEPHLWDGSGADTLPVGDVIFDVANLSAVKDEVDSFQVVFPDATEAAAFYLDGYLQDPDMYVAKDFIPFQDHAGEWVTDHTSFNASGVAEFIGVLAPDTNAIYNTAIHAFSAYSDARLRVIAVDDPLLCDGCKRVLLNDEAGLTALKGNLDKTYSFKIPKAAKKVVLVIPNGYTGDPDLLVGVDKAPMLDATEAVMTDSDCVPFSAPGLTEYCEFGRGGRFNIAINPYLDYSDVQFQVYYVIAKDANIDPTASITAPRNLLTRHAAVFSATQSTDPDGSVVSYLWNFGDGTQSTEIEPLHTFSEAGEYRVSLTVTDNVGETDQIDVLISVTDPLLGDWNLDGQVDKTDIQALMRAIQRGEQIDARYDLNQDSLINMLDVRLLSGYCSYEQCSTQPPPPKPPVANANGNYRAQSGETIQFSSAGSYDPDGEIVAYFWQFGDGSTSTNANPSHSYSLAGIFDVSLTVTDASGDTHTSTALANISFPAAPVLADVCSAEPPLDVRSLTNGQAHCMPTKSRVLYSIANVRAYKSLAITLNYGAGNANLYYKNGGWPKVNVGDFHAKSDRAGNSECIFINNLNGEMNYWGYLEIQGEAQGSSIALDFNVNGCRSTATE